MMRPSQLSTTGDRPSPARVPASSIARALDEIIERRKLKQPYALYRQIARDAGVHPTTVLRYHTGRLTTARKSVRSRTLALLDAVRRGNPLPFELSTQRVRRSTRTEPPPRVSTAALGEMFEEIRRALELEQCQFLYRYLAERLGVHATTIMRYVHGELKSAPAQVFFELDELRERIARGEAVPFKRKVDGNAIIVRERTAELLRRLLGDRDNVSRTAVFRKVEDRLALKPGTLARIYYNRKLVFVPADLHRALEKVVDGAEYDASAVYRKGDRICHHLFGLGTVQKKVHKDKVLVEFVDGRHVLLSEAVPEDPFAFLCGRDAPDLRVPRSTWCASW